MKQIKLKAEKIIAILIVAVMLMGVAPMGELSNFAVKASAASVVDSGKCGDNVTWTLDSEGTLTVSGEGGDDDCTVQRKWKGQKRYR